MMAAEIAIERQQFTTQPTVRHIDILGEEP
jgi:hypothetical protein